MPLNDPIAAIATPAGKGAIGIVRISGHDLQAIAQRLIGSLPRPRTATLRSIRAADGSRIDQAIVIYFAGPESYTGEDIVEIQTHGGSVLTHDVLTAAITAGARLAAAGEFSQRAFLNGKIDLIQAEAVADLIDSGSSRAARLALSSLIGGFSTTVQAITNELKQIRVELEAYIDFPEEEIPPPTVAALVSRSVNVHQQLTDLLDNAEIGAKLNSGLDISIVGRPNVGKSTLLNVLANEDRAIVTAIPGTTRDVLSIEINISGLLVRIHDTAGLRDSRDVIEREGIKRTKQKIEQSDAVLHVVSSDNDELSAFIASLTIPVFTIRNKIDQASLTPLVKKTSHGAYVQISAKFNQGIDQLRNAIVEHFSLAEDSDNVVLARERHLVALRAAQQAINFDHQHLYTESSELGAERIRMATNALGVLTGEYGSEDLLGDIFSKFCIGK